MVSGSISLPPCGGGSGWGVLRRHPCPRSLERPRERMFPATVEQPDRLDSAPNRLGGGQQLDPGPALSIFRHALDLIEMDQGDQAPLVGDIAQEARRVGEDQ